MHILVKDKRTGIEEWMPLEAAAELMDLDAPRSNGRWKSSENASRSTT